MISFSPVNVIFSHTIHIITVKFCIRAELKQAVLVHISIINTTTNTVTKC